MLPVPPTGDALKILERIEPSYTLFMNVYTTRAIEMYAHFHE